MFSMNAIAGSGLVCGDVSDGALGGFEVRFLTKSDGTTVARIGHFHSKKFSQLVCTKMEADSAMQGSADSILVCSEEFVSDSGYLVITTDRDSTGKQYATLSNVSFLGSSEIAKLPCRSTERE